ncbi:translocase [uncultured Marivita sp.]|uniref:translocase n=1 Tax=uncultured Marivita sp. TaxID=888080 RepID=UPI0026349AC9|nr:translocase [uncultured Marivita sp.]
MDRKASIRIATATVVSALAIGAAMQYWPTSSDTESAQAPLVVSDVQDVSSAPRNIVPSDMPITASLPSSVISAAVTSVEEPKITVPTAPKDSGFACEVDMTATPIAGAMMTVTLSAPCHGSDRVTFHHNGLMFTEVMQPDGSLTVDVPALTENALVIASFMDGAGAVATAEVTSVPFYDRVALQWRGNAGLQLHAREFDAEYFTDGHIWQGSIADPTRAATGEGGFLTKLGAADAPDALLAEVYTFPSGMTEASGTVALTVETEILASNCDTSVEAQTLELRNGSALMSKELTIDVPGCDAVGDFLLLKNIVEDLTIAAK